MKSGQVFTGRLLTHVVLLDETRLMSHITPIQDQRPSSALTDIGIRRDLEPTDVIWKQAVEQASNRLG